MVSVAPDLAIPTATVCVLKAAQLESAPAFRLTPGGLAFATVRTVHNARVHVTTDPVGTGLVMQVTSGPLELSGVTRASELPVYATKPVRLGGIFLPFGTTSLRIAGTSGKSLRLEAARTPFSLRALTMPLADDVACTTPSLTATQTNVRASLGKGIGRGHFVASEVPLSLTADGEPVATLLADERAVDILERLDTSARVAWSADEGVVTGWVPAAYLGKPMPKGERGSGRLGGRHSTSEGGPHEKKMCPHDVALGVTVADEAMFVGRVRARAVIDVFAHSRLAGAEWSRVRVPGAEAHLENGAQFFVRTADVAGCPNVPAAQVTPRSP